MVCPEGILSETQELFNFTKQLSTHFPNISFYFRLHPMIGNKYLNQFNFMSKNFYLSKNSLEQDLIKCNILLYKGSHTVIKGLMFGLIPIYYNNNKSININPIFDSKLKFFQSHDLRSFKQIVLKKVQKYNTFKKNYNYSKKFYATFNKDKFIKLL